MPDSPAGVYTLPPSYKVNNGDTSDASQHNPPFEDIAAALTERLCRDGRTSWTGNQNANGHKLTNLAPGTNPGDALTVDGIGTAIASAPKKSAIVNTDRIALSDSEDSQKLKYVTVETISDLVKNDLGDAATKNVGTTSGTVAAGDDSRITGAVQKTDTSTAGFAFVVDEDNMASNSATKVPTQQSVKAYVDGAVNRALGVGQSWQSFSRTFNTSYQNTTGRTIAILIHIFTGTSSAFTPQWSQDNSNWTAIGLPASANEGQHATTQAFFILQPGEYYRVNRPVGSGSATITVWELR